MGYLGRYLSLIWYSETPMKAGEVGKGFSIGEYEIKRELGRGGVAVVYEGEYDFMDGYTEPDVAAFKVFRPDGRFGDVERLRLRFRFEQWMAGRFLCKYLLTGGWGRDGDTPFIKYGRVGSGDLKGLIRGSNVQRGSNPLRLMAQILIGTSFLHANGYVHRDLKPNNIIIIDDRATVADFGIVRHVDKAHNQDTHTADVVGSRDYIAPEQRRNPRSATRRSDIYSLGVLFYELVTGTLPHYDYVPLKEKNPAYAFLDRPLRRMMATEPMQRPATVRAAFSEIFSAWADNIDLPELLPQPTYPQVGLLFVRKMLREYLETKRFGPWYKYKVWHIEDYVSMFHYWEGKNYNRRTTVRTPSLTELRDREPDVVAEFDGTVDDVVHDLLSDAENTISKNARFSELEAQAPVRAMLGAKLF